MQTAPVGDLHGRTVLGARETLGPEGSATLSGHDDARDPIQVAGPAWGPERLEPGRYRGRGAGPGRLRWVTWRLRLGKRRLLWGSGPRQGQADRADPSPG